VLREGVHLVAEGVAEGVFLLVFGWHHFIRMDVEGICGDVGFMDLFV